MVEMENQNAKRFYEAVNALPERISGILRRVPAQAAMSAQEVRLRVGQPLALYNGTRHQFLNMDGSCAYSPSPESVRVTRADLFDCFRTLCGYSVHTHQHEIAHGYISLSGGHRAGICGTLSGEGEKAGLRDISSINLRVARQIKGAASDLARRVFQDGLCGVLIAGAPSSGKTTVLRDLARILSGGELGEYYKVAMVDERCELAAVHQGVPQNDIGLCTDLLYGYAKRAGIEIAVRTLSPQVIVCDEIGREEELEAVRLGLFCAVEMITTVHSANEEDLKRRPAVQALLRTGAFQKVVLLCGSRSPGQVEKIISAGELRA